MKKVGDKKIILSFKKQKLVSNNNYVYNLEYSFFNPLEVASIREQQLMQPTSNNVLDPVRSTFSVTIGFFHQSSRRVRNGFI